MQSNNLIGYQYQTCLSPIAVQLEHAIDQFYCSQSCNKAQKSGQATCSYACEKLEEGSGAYWRLKKVYQAEIWVDRSEYHSDY